MNSEDVRALGDVIEQALRDEAMVEDRGLHNEDAEPWVDEPLNLIVGVVTKAVVAALEASAVSPGKVLREFHGDGVWRDDEGAVWMRQSEAVEAVRSAVSTPPTITDARIAAIEAVHPKHFTKPYGNGVGARVEGTENLTGQERYACGSCERHWPCPTIAALHPGGETNG